MRLAGVVAAALCGAGWAVAVAAQTISEAEFIGRVTDAHPALLELGGDLAATEAARWRAGLMANPDVSFDREDPEDNPRQDTWTVTWTPPLPGKYRLERQAADAGLRAARLRFEAERRRVREEARRVYADWSLAVFRRELLAIHAEQLRALADKARLRADSGEDSGLSARRLRLAGTEVTAQLATVEATRARAAAEAAAWYGELAAGATPTLPGLPEVPAPTPDHRTLEHRALEADLDRARAARRLQSRFWRAPELSVGRQTLRDVGRSRYGIVWAVSWSVPLFDRGQPERALARRHAEIAEARVGLAARREHGQVEAAVASYRALRDGVRAIEPEVRDPSGVVAGALASYRAGESSVTDLLDTLEGVRSASLRWLELYQEAHAAHRALERWLGPPEGDRK